ncbi:MAG: DUF4019 domain-containing protein, partial [Phycisphaerae bacterium]|nr:DUF4019 domain-containing protein [Phycisphaerae bacterium]
TGSGVISLPGLPKPIKVQGMTQDQVRDAIVKAYAKILRNPSVSVMILGRPADLPKDFGQHRLAPGEVVKISVLDLLRDGQEATFRRQVSGSGVISLPLLPKPIKVQGMTQDQLRDAVVKAYAEPKILMNPSVSVMFPGWQLAKTPDPAVDKARAVAEAFLSAAIAGKDAEAIKLTDPRSAVPHQVKDFRELPDAKSLKVVSVYADDKTALAVTTETRADHGRKGPLLIRLIKQRGLWVVTDIDIETPAKAKDKLKRFLKKHPDAKPVTLAPVRRAALVATNRWLHLVDQGKYDTSWDKAAAFFKSAVTKQKWAASIKGVRAPLGKAKSRTFVSALYTTSLPGAPDGEYVVIQYLTSFENKKQAVETITPMKDKDGKWRVSGYYIK